MGRQAAKKAQQRELKRSRPHLLPKLREQRELLRFLGNAFDAGNPILGYPLATTIRVLVHDTGASHSLLAQLGDQDDMPFLDTAPPINRANLLPSNGLTIMEMTAGVGSRWVPRLKGGEPAPGTEPRDVPFGPWWTFDVAKDGEGTFWSRKKMVLAIANKEGGAHLDPNQPLDIKAIEHDNSMGWMHHDPIVGDQPMSNGPLMPSIRQIAHELETSITRRFEADIGH